jgi:tetratricopeptide (TPR) repeat protein
VARRLGASGSDAAAHTGRLLQRLWPPAECLESRAQPAWSAARRSELQAEEVGAAAHVRLGHYPRVLERIEQLLPRARAEDPAAAAALLMLRGLTLVSLAQGEAAVAAYRESVREADRAGDDEASLSARLRLANAYSNALVRGEQGYEAAQDAQAWLLRLGSPPAWRWTWEAAFCSAEWARESGGASMDHCLKAVELATAVHGAGSVQAADAAETTNAAAPEQVGRRAEAVDEYRKALRVYEAIPFKQPFDLATAWGNLAISLGNLGRAQEALEAVDAGWRYLANLGAEAAPFEAWFCALRGGVLEDGGDFEGASRALRPGDRGLHRGRRYHARRAEGRPRADAGPRGAGGRGAAAGARGGGGGAAASDLAERASCGPRARPGPLGHRGSARRRWRWRARRSSG